MKAILTYLFLALILCVNGQNASRTIEAFKTSTEITIDGELSESIWKEVAWSGDFDQHFPSDTSKAMAKTEVAITYNDAFIYVAAICYEDEGEYVIQSLKRDFSFPRNDAFTVLFDPFLDQMNGFSFGVTPYNSQREGVIEGGGSFGVSTAWDNKWYSKVKRYKDKWVVEMAIPLKSIRFKPGLNEWGINFARNDLSVNENSCWNFVPRNFNVSFLAYSGRLKFKEQLNKTGQNLSLIPYLTAGYNENHEVNPTSKEVLPNGGMDAKVAVSSSLNLDITVNPDFSQVEVDRQVTNLSRYSLFFPERRQFFIENSDLFSQFGFRQIRPFFSRKIGLNSGEIVPIYFGARLSGKVNEKLRIGAMNMQTAKKDNLGLGPQNYSVMAFQRRTVGASYLGGIFVNRTNTSDIADNNSVAGLDYNFISKNNKWRGKVFYHQSFDKSYKQQNYTHASWLMYSSPTWWGMWNHEYVGFGYEADVGFVPRIYEYNQNLAVMEKQSYWRFEPMVSYTFYPKAKQINSHTISTYLSDYYNEDFESTNREANARWSLDFLNSSNFTFAYFYDKATLLYDTDVSFSGQPALEAGVYEQLAYEVGFTSNTRNVFNWSLNYFNGDFYNGDWEMIQSAVNYRFKHLFNISLDYSRNKIFLPIYDAPVVLNLFGPKMELTLRNNLFLTTFFQYNDQVNNFNINTRFQWRFKPMSDLYLVYTDNYYTPELGLKNRSLVLKCTYWISI